MRQDNAKDHFRYICVGSLDDPEALPPKGEFFCKTRASWMPEIPGESFQHHDLVYLAAGLIDLDVFHKQEIQQ